MRDGTEVRALTRGLQLLELLAANRQGLPLSGIARELNLAKSSAHRLLQTLIANGYARRGTHDNAYYFASLKLLTLSSHLIKDTELSVIARPHLDYLAHFSGETVHLVMCDGQRAVYVDKVEAPSSIRMVSQIGHDAPLHCTGVGKAILAFMHEREWDDLLNGDALTRFTETTVTDPHALRTQLRSIRAMGYAIDNGEHEQHVRCIAAPLFTRTQTVAGAVSIAAVSYRVDVATLESWRDVLLERVRQLNLELFQCLDRYM